MKYVLVLALLFCAAFAAPTEDLKAVEVAEEAPEEQVVSVADAAAEAPEETKVAAAARFNFCPPGWFFYGSRCYLYVRTSKNWFDAEDHCKTMGAQLASATNPSESAFMKQMMQAAGASFTWIGGFYLQGRWMWIDRQPTFYSDWYSRVTDTSNSCLLLHAPGWHNNPCTSAWPFICSKNPFGC